MRWGLVPLWRKKPLNKLAATFNARAENGRQETDVLIGAQVAPAHHPRLRLPTSELPDLCERSGDGQAPPEAITLSSTEQSVRAQLGVFRGFDFQEVGRDENEHILIFTIAVSVRHDHGCDDLLHAVRPRAECQCPGEVPQYGRPAHICRSLWPDWRESPRGSLVLGRVYSWRKCELLSRSERR